MQIIQKDVSGQYYIFAPFLTMVLKTNVFIKISQKFMGVVQRIK
jgi:hypothetical protein